ncbi:MAG: N-acetylmuramoyl-L-alanine amidase, partial [bacterium]|nr:N-acetylmuramoyl-L-alanine amidase [bacterium]
MDNYSRAVKGVVIDAGHGGNDPGAVNGNIYEKDFTLEVAKYIYDRLNQLGIPAAITRTTDETLNRDERVSRILNAFGNDPNVIVLSNHINAGG